MQPCRSKLLTFYPSPILSFPPLIPMSVTTNTTQPVASVKPKHPLYFPQSPRPTHPQDRPTPPPAHVPNAAFYSDHLLCHRALGLHGCHGFLTAFPAVIHPPTHPIPHPQHPQAATLSTLHVFGPLSHLTALHHQCSCNAGRL